MKIERLKQIIDLSLNGYNTQKQRIEAFCDGYYAPYYNFFCLMAMALEKPLCVELGVDKGRGSRSLWIGGARVYGVEEQSKECFTLPSMLELTFLKYSSTPVPKEIQDAGEIDLIHFDTEHTYSQVAAEFKAYKPFLKDGCVMCFDDTHAAEDEVLKYVNELPYEKVHDDRLHPGCGFSVVIYRRGV